MIYDEIKKKAKEKGISIYRIEKDLGLGNASISKWNRVTPSSINLMKVAHYLDVSLEKILKFKQGGKK